MVSKEERRRYGAKPFWAWNGKLNKDELLRQIHVMQTMGFGGFFMHSRTGLETDYLGDEWFSLINACADEGKRLGMEAWLYDEDRWPSGSAGGIATREERYRMKYLRLNRTTAAAFSWNDDVVSAFATRLDGVDFYGKVRLYKGDDAAKTGLPDVVYFTTETMNEDPTYNGATYLDTLSREATEHFLDTTHKRYAEECGDRVGDAITGIFTDEPYRGALMSGFSVPNHDRCDLCPYTPTLFDEYDKAFGSRLENDLPELFLRPEGCRFSPVKWRYTELVTRLFLENYARPYYERCRRYGLKVTGHILHENSLTCQVSTMGSVMRYYGYMDIPGVDYLGEYGREYCVVKQLSSACRQLGKTEMLSELDGCTGWHMTFDRYKHIGDWQAVMGITLRCPHLSWYTMKGEAKRDYPSSILHQSSWYEAYGALEDHYTRLSALVSNAKRRCHVGVLMPVESVWAQIRAGWATDMSPVDENVIKLDTIFTETYRALLGAHVDFDYIDEAMLAEMGSVSGAALCVGKASYDTVIVSGMETMRSTTLAALKALHEAGGEVVFAGDVPALVDVVPCDDVAAFAATCTRVPQNGLATLRPDAEISSDDVLLQTYEADGKTLWLLLNTLPDTALENVTVSLPDAGKVYEYDLESGKTALLGSAEKMVERFCPGALRVFVTGTEEDAEPKKRYTPVRTASAKAVQSVAFDEPNVLLLDRVTFSLDGAQEQGPYEVLDADTRLRACLSLPPRGGLMYQPWFIKSGDDKPRADATVRYRFTCDALPTAPVYLVVEDAENINHLYVNEKPVTAKPEPGVLYDSCYTRYDVSALVRTGENTVTLCFGYRPSSGLESAFIVGDFAVNDRFALCPAGKDTLTFGSLTDAGYPFYGGKVTYTLTFDDAPKEGERAVLHLYDRENAACYEVDGKPVPFAPFEADVTDTLKSGKPVTVAVYLTRRNTFGPFYITDKNPPFIGPDAFHQEQTDRPVLLSSGLVTPPTVTMERECVLC